MMMLTSRRAQPGFLSPHRVEDAAEVGAISALASLSVVAGALVSGYDLLSAALVLGVGAVITGLQVAVILVQR